MNNTQNKHLAKIRSKQQQQEGDMKRLQKRHLILEHVLLNRNKPIVDDKAEMPRKKLTRNLNNSPQKQSVDVDLVEMERFIKMHRVVA